MISLILPYWNRQEAADKALALLEQHYAGLPDLEVVIVDDGNPVPFRAPPTKLKLTIARLPTKREPKSPCLCWNEGAKVAQGEILVLSCIEVLHEKPVLQAMLEEHQRSGPDAYVLAAAWCPEQQAWHTHSTVEVPECPPGTGLGFLGMLTRDLYFKAGGWDEEYREGAGYEDRDFIHRLTHAGAKFVKRDDLVVTHPKAGASIAWGAEKFARNRALFEAKWLNRKKVTFCCVQAQDYCGRGAEYVNTLFDMVLRNLPWGVAFRFVCLTDDPKGLDGRIETIPLPADLEGWYGKLYLFKRDLFPAGERMVFMDLDTIILGSLDDLLRYEGEFATLEDFYFPERLGPAVMLWKAGGKASSIWSGWVDAGKPRNTLGDLWWINQLDEGRFAESADRLQRLYPGFFASYKRDCAPIPPKGAKVVCFHGKPRPHEAAERDDWVAMAWKVGGSVPANLEVVANTAYEDTARNIKAACLLPWPWLPLVSKVRRKAVAIVGGGPSLAGKLDELRGNVKAGMRVFATNGAHDYLLSQGIVPDAHVIIDARPENARFITTQAKAYFLASQCAPEVFDLARGDVTIVHMNTRGVLASIPESLKPVNLISSGSTVGLAAMAIAYCIGYRQLYIYGMDSSYEDTRHAYPQSLNDQDRVIEAVAGGRKFKCAPWMVAQVEHFQKLSGELAKADCEIHVRCGGLLGHVAWTWTHQEAA